MIVISNKCLKYAHFLEHTDFCLLFQQQNGNESYLSWSVTNFIFDIILARIQTGLLTIHTEKTCVLHNSV